MADADNTTHFYIYAHRTADDGKIFYIGKGKKNRAYSKQRSIYWHNKVNKHGYTVEIIASNLTEQQSFDMEREFIAFYGRENLVNLTDGGDGASGAKRSAETIAKNIALHTGRKRSKESCKRMSDAQKSSKNRRDISGENNPSKRDDVREKMRRPREYMKGENNPMHRPETKAKLISIMQSKEYKEKMSASVKASILNPDIAKKRKDSIIKAYENPERRRKAIENMRFLNSNPKVKEKCKNSRAIFYQTNGRKILCVETGIVFRFQREAVDWLKSNGFPKATATRVSEVVKMIRKTAYGYTWRYA